MQTHGKRVATLLLTAAWSVPWSTANGQTPRDVIYRSDFASGLSGFQRIFHYYGEAELSLDSEKRGPSGAPSHRVDLAQKTKTIVGIKLPVRPGQRVRVALAGAAELQECERLRVALKCVSAKGKQVAWIDLGAFPRQREFGHLRSPTLEIPQSMSRAYLFIFPDGARGRLWLADVVVRAAGIPAELEADLAVQGPTVWGINDALALAYHKPHDATISDTSAKLMATVGFTRARLWCWWGSRSQLKNDINQGGVWLMLDRRDDGYDFSALGHRLDRLAQYGLRPGAVIVQGTPEWASGKSGDHIPAAAKRNWRARRKPFFPPRDWADYEQFVTALVSQFKDRVRIWEVMNEPNTPDTGLQGGHRAYMDYLRRFHKAAKEVDPSCTVLCSRVGVDWLGKMLADDPTIVDCFDAIVSHPYSNGGDDSFAKTRALQLRMADAGFLKPIYMTEVGFFGGKWKDPRPGSVVQAEMAAKVRQGLPLMAKLSKRVTWWNSVFKSYAHGLLRDEGVCLRPLDQYWAFGDVTGRLSKSGGPVKASVELPSPPVRIGQEALVRLAATNASDEPQTIRFWPVGFVTALGVTLEEIRAHEWEGVLPVGGVRSATLRIRPSAEAEKHSLPVGLTVINGKGNSLALEVLPVSPAAPQEVRTN